MNGKYVIAVKIKNYEGKIVESFLDMNTPFVVLLFVLLTVFVMIEFICLIQ